MMKRFTVLELLGLVFVIGVFIVIFMPCTFHTRGHREKARRLNCHGNLKHIGVAMYAYSAENSGNFPDTAAGNSFERLDREEYLPSSKVYGCPSAATLSSTASNSNYWYVGSGVRDDVKDAEHVMLAYDMFGNHPDNARVNVLYADGHAGGGRPDPKRGLYDNTHAVVPKE